MDRGQVHKDELNWWRTTDHNPNFPKPIFWGLK